MERQKARLKSSDLPEGFPPWGSKEESIAKGLCGSPFWCSYIYVAGHPFAKPRCGTVGQTIALPAGENVP